jgi:chromosome segregation ATPase
VSEDLLEALVLAGLAEGSLDERTLPRFLEALRARADEILADRVQPIVDRAVAFEKESAWRAGLVEALERDKEALIAERANLIAERDALIGEKEALALEDEHRVAENEALKREREALIVENQALSRECESLRAYLARERASLGSQIEALRVEKSTASEAHDRLLEHHEAVLARFVEVLSAARGDLPWRYRRVRAGIQELLDGLGKEP